MENIYNKNEAYRIVETLAAAGHCAYLVGGFVRDLVRGEPSHDYDIATSATPEEVKALFPHTAGVGVSFGVVLVIVEGVPYEVATFRTDIGYSDGRRPDEVRFTTPEEDAKRRDFTINGMFYDPLNDRLIDYVGGRRDIERKIIRTIGNPDDRFNEDKLRILRAARFAAKLGYEIDPDTASAIKKHAKDILIVSSERIREEIVKILVCTRPRIGMELASELGLLIHILPEIENMKAVGQPPEFHPEGDVWTHTMLCLDNLPPSPEIELAAAALLHDVGKPDTFMVKERIRFDGHAEIGAEIADKILRRLRFSKKQQDLVVELVRNHLKFMNVQDMRTSTLKRFLRMERFDLHLELHRIDCAASHARLDNWEFCRGKLDEFAKHSEPLRPPRLIGGADLIEMGLRPGPEFSVILKEIEDAQLEKRIVSREDAVAFVKERHIEGKN